jgi:hypothetical protein
MFGGAQDWMSRKESNLLVSCLRTRGCFIMEIATIFTKYIHKRTTLHGSKKVYLFLKAAVIWCSGILRTVLFYGPAPVLWPYDE